MIFPLLVVTALLIAREMLGQGLPFDTVGARRGEPMQHVEPLIEAPRRPPRQPTRDRSTLRFKSGVALAGQAPRELRAWTTVRNVGRIPVTFAHGSCMLNIRLWHDSARTGAPAWRSERRGPLVRTGDRPIAYACTSELNIAMLWPRDSQTFRLNVPVAEILADTLPNGRYWASLQLRFLNDSLRPPDWETLYLFPVGSVVLARAPDPWPSVRVYAGVRYEAAASVARDSLHVFTMITNVGKRSIDVRVDTPNPLQASGFYPGTLYEAPWIMRRSAFSWGPGRVTGQRILRLRPGDKWLFERAESLRNIVARHGEDVEFQILAHVFGQHNATLYAGSVKLAGGAAAREEQGQRRSSHTPRAPINTATMR
jgi:hypothetical protein